MAKSKLTQCQNFFVLLLSFSFIPLILFALYYYIHTFAYVCACTHTHKHTYFLIFFLSYTSFPYTYAPTLVFYGTHGCVWTSGSLNLYLFLVTFLLFFFLFVLFYLRHQLYILYLLCYHPLEACLFSSERKKACGSVLGRGEKK